MKHALVLEMLAGESCQADLVLDLGGYYLIVTRTQMSCCLSKVFEMGTRLNALCGSTVVRMRNAPTAVAVQGFQTFVP